MKKSMKKSKDVRKFSLKEHYVKSWSYIKESKNFIFLIIGFFVFSALIGFFVPASDLVTGKILEFIEDILSRTEGMNQVQLISFIFLNNLEASFVGFASGILLGIIPMIVTLANGYVVGFVSKMSVDAEGVVSLWRLLPHGIFELPALFISLGLGLKFGSFIFQKNKEESFRAFLVNSLRVFVFIVIPLLIIAAIIEGSLIALSI